MVMVAKQKGSRARFVQSDLARIVDQQLCPHCGTVAECSCATPPLPRAQEIQHEPDTCRVCNGRKGDHYSWCMSSRVEHGYQAEWDSMGRRIAHGMGSAGVAEQRASLSAHSQEQTPAPGRCTCGPHSA